MREWLRRHKHDLPLLIFFIIEGDIVFGLWPQDIGTLTTQSLLLLLTRFSIATLAWWIAWSLCWRKGILSIVRTRRRQWR
jgi:hypothetical protein